MKRGNSSSTRSAMKLLCALLGGILAIMLGITFYFQKTLGPENAPGPDLSAMLDFSGELSFPELPQLPGADDRIGGTGSGLVNILLIGQDRREGESGSRSDSMILCTFNKKTRQLILTSFLRDLYVPIPGNGSNRINAAYSLGGTELLNRTLEENFNLHIDGNVEVDFAQFSQIIDLLGGVEIQLRQDEAELINKETGSSLEAGLRTLDGTQALAYARIRKLDTDGDFSRTNRQRMVMEAIWDAYRGSGVTTLLKLLRNVLPMVDTDMGTGEILSCAVSVFPYLSDVEIVSQRIPADSQYSDQFIDGMSVLVADMDAARDTLRSTLTGKTEESIQ